MSLKNAFSDVLKGVSPPLWLALHARRLAGKAAEQESRLLPLLACRHEASIDAGANVGDYTWHLRRHSTEVFAFEPVPELAQWLRRAFRDRVTVHECGLSDRDGSAELLIPMDAGGSDITGHASVLAHADWGDIAIRKVPIAMRRLGSLGLPRIGFIKVDVEGHELEVMQGAQGLLQRDLPTLLVEAEERHRPGAVEQLRGVLEPMGYRGCFLASGRLEDIGKFQTGVHQSVESLKGNGAAPYINNFIFVARNDVRERLARARLRSM